MGEEENYFKKLAQGAFAFDSFGNEMLVKKANLNRIPSMLTESLISVDGVTI